MTAGSLRRAAGAPAFVARRPALMRRAGSRELPAVAVVALAGARVIAHHLRPQTHRSRPLTSPPPAAPPSAAPPPPPRPRRPQPLSSEHAAPTIAPWQPLACTCCSASREPAAPYPPHRPSRLLRIESTGPDRLLTSLTSSAADLPQPPHVPHHFPPRGAGRQTETRGAGRSGTQGFGAESRRGHRGGAEGSSLSKRGDIPRILA